MSLFTEADFGPPRAARSRSGRPPRRPARGATASEPSHLTFGWATAWVALIHVLLIILLFTALRPPRRKPPVSMIQLLPSGTLVRGTPGLGPTGGSPAPTSPAPASTPPPLPSPAPTPSPPAPKPVPAPTRKTPATPKPDTLPAPKPVATKPPPPKPTPKPVAVDLRPVKRSDPESPAAAKPSPAPKKAASATAPATAPTPAPGLSPADVRSRLASRVNNAGVATATGAGPSGVAGGRGPADETSAFYTLIRDTYYQAWRQPVALAPQRLSTILKIRVGKDGRILHTQIEQSSGNPVMDESVREAARGVATVGQPLPPALGSEFADITVTFEM